MIAVGCAMSKRKKPEPQETNFLNATADAVPGYSITNLSEQDVLELHEGRVPEWLKEVTASWLAWTKGPAVGLRHDREARALGDR